MSQNWNNFDEFSILLEQDGKKPSATGESLMCLSAFISKTLRLAKADYKLEDTLPSYKGQGIMLIEGEISRTESDLLTQLEEQHNYEEYIDACSVEATQSDKSDAQSERNPTLLNYPSEDSQQEFEFSEANEVISSTELLSKFEKEVDITVKKATNIPKWLFGLLFSYIRTIQGGYRYQRWTDSIGREFQGKASRQNRFSIIQLLCDNVLDSDERRNWKKVHRECLAKILTEDRMGNILENVSIPAKSKLHYLYYSKMLECRLNNQALLSHIQ